MNKKNKTLTIALFSSFLAIVAGVEYSAMNTTSIHAEEIVRISMVAEKAIHEDNLAKNRAILKSELREEEILEEKYLIDNISPVSEMEARKALPEGVKYANKEVIVYRGTNELEEKIGTIAEDSPASYFEVMSNGWLLVLHEDSFGYVDGAAFRDTEARPLPPKVVKPVAKKVTAKTVAKTATKPASGKEMSFRLSFYTNIPGENGKYTTTASGKHPTYGMIASNIYPFGTKIYLEGYGEMTVEDRGGKHFNSSDRLDVFIQRKDGESNANYRARAMKLGRQTVKGTILN